MSPTLGDESSSTLATLLSVGICGGYISSAACFVIASQCTPPLLEEEQQMDDKWEAINSTGLELSLCGLAVGYSNMGNIQIKAQHKYM